LHQRRPFDQIFGDFQRRPRVSRAAMAALYLIYGSILVLNSMPEKMPCHFPDEANPMCPDTTA
jgi:hypothetical protein